MNILFLVKVLKDQIQLDEIYKFFAMISSNFNINLRILSLMFLTPRSEFFVKLLGFVYVSACYSYYFHDFSQFTLLTAFRSKLFQSNSVKSIRRNELDFVQYFGEILDEFQQVYPRI